MSRRIVLHIGNPRTGTTSIQQALADQRGGLLARAGIQYPEGIVMSNNHMELHFASMRGDRLEELDPFNDWVLMRLNNQTKHCRDPIWAERVAKAIEHTSGDRLVYSWEGLSSLRYPDEIERVVRLFPDSEISVVMFERKAEDFLRSFEWAMRAIGQVPSDDPDSACYFAPDSWLVDYAARADLWRGAPGIARVEVLSYEACMQVDGSTVPALFEAIGIDRSELIALDSYRLNARPPHAY